MVLKSLKPNRMIGSSVDRKSKSKFKTQIQRNDLHFGFALRICTSEDRITDDQITPMIS